MKFLKENRFSAWSKVVAIALIGVTVFLGFQIRNLQFDYDFEKFFPVEDADADGEEEVTLTLDKEMAHKLCDLLKAACGDEDADEDAAEESNVDSPALDEQDNQLAEQGSTKYVEYYFDFNRSRFRTVNSTNLQCYGKS